MKAYVAALIGVTQLPGSCAGKAGAAREMCWQAAASITVEHPSVAKLEVEAGTDDVNVFDVEVLETEYRRLAELHLGAEPNDEVCLSAIKTDVAPWAPRNAGVRRPAQDTEARSGIR